MPPGFCGGSDDQIFGQTEVIDPPANMGLCGPALPPGGQGAVRIKAQRSQQLCEETIKVGIARLRVLLLLYRFS